MYSRICSINNKKKKNFNNIKENKFDILIHWNIRTCIYTVCPTRYRTRHFFNNSNTNEDIATKFEQEYVRCVRNEVECVCSAPNCCDTEQRSARLPGSGAKGTHCICVCMLNPQTCFTLLVAWNFCSERLQCH